MSNTDETRPSVNDRLEMELVLTMILAKRAFTEVLRPFGVETVEWHALQRLAETDGPSQTELAALMLRDKVAITRLVATLVDKGLVERRSDPQDGRKQRLHLTAEATRLLPELEAARARVAEVVEADLGEGDLAELRRIMKILRDGYLRWLEPDPKDRRT